MRDKALLLLMALLGMRSSEVRRLQFQHLAWRSAEVHLPATKSRRERRLPLPQEAGAALADYVLHGRPPLNVPYVFLRHTAPLGPIAGAHTLSAVVRKHLRRAAIDVSSGGAHMLRHSLATQMVNTGVPIKEIADVLGHESIDTTAIYTKVDLTNLAAVALPFPGSAT
jgi:integrase